MGIWVEACCVETAAEVRADSSFTLSSSSSYPQGTGGKRGLLAGVREPQPALPHHRRSGDDGEKPAPVAAEVGGGAARMWKTTLMATHAVLLVAVLIALCGPVLLLAATDSSDVQALQVLYGSLNNPPQLSGWKANGGDPCGESWKGVSCSGSAVVSIQIPGLQLNGSLGYMLSGLLSLKTLDMSNNNIHETIPYQLPPNLTYLNVSRNLLSQSIGDVFKNLEDLSVLDLSFNNFSGDLPNSFGFLSNLSSLYLQNNQLSGQISINRNIANNHFTGWIPHEFSLISNLRIDGNAFDNGPAPPPPPYTSPPPGRSRSNHSHPRPPTDSTKGSKGGNPSKSEDKNKKGSMIGPILGIAFGSLFVGLLAFLAVIFCLRKRSAKSKGAAKNTSKNSSDSPVIAKDKVTSKEAQEVLKNGASVTSLTPLPNEEAVTDKSYGKNGSMKRQKLPITATYYTVASLQSATNSFSQESLVGEGSLGRVYRAELSNGKVLAVKKIESAALSLQEEDNFLEAVSNMSRLRHPNIVTLLGYCAEHGQRLVVHEFIGNGTLHDILHYADDSSKILSWNARVKVALGTARALEYLHEVCLPSVVHKNLKSANILLDEELNPHLSDCGIAVLTPNTERQSLVRWATPQLHDIDSLAKMVDPSLNGMYPAKSLSRFADIIALCVQPEPEFRPPMSEVVQALVRLVQRASIIKRRSGDELGFSYKVPEHDAPTDMTF
ncbi:hypothetical protein Taro_036064 [Colocasia esculenta]|uniref:Protein kinase domain-containing protein n=1 Tax=Colocasia esculenta TaxID=4460 RepID=A0A843W8K7_COLES|nr:hypothetical protein [Colocasia esculenta]